MKTLEEIKQAAEKADYARVGAIVGKSSSLVRMVVNDARHDHHNIQKTFSDMLEHREKLSEREKARRARKQVKNLLKA
jgi:hypothetical protein